MATTESDHPTDPSSYIASHLQTFAPPARLSPIDPWQAGVDAAIALAIVIACLALRKRWFGLSPRMSAKERVAVWWSCTWRQLLFGLPIYALAVAATIWLPMAWMQHGFAHPHAHAGFAPTMAALFLTLIGMYVPLIVATLVFWLPVTGYTVRSGLGAHALPVPARLSFRRASLLGLTTLLWTIPGWLLIGLACAPLQGRGGERWIGWFSLIVYCLWGICIVLPRQTRRAMRWRAGTV